jgi:dTDP-4-dehydrorhamnose reductase
MKLAVIGPNGQVGSEIMRAGRAAGLECLGLDHRQIEVTDQRSVERALTALDAGDAVVNTAAFHRTDECEDRPDRALSINAVGAFRVAAEAQRRGATAVYLSSDFVFDGCAGRPYVESDAPHPLNVYGATKLAGEILVRAGAQSHCIARISSVFGLAGSAGKGGNFVETILAKARSGESPRVVDDIVMAPTSARDAAGLLVTLLRVRAPGGIYHLANAGQCSWYEFANAILELDGSSLRATPTSASQAGGKAARPRYSVLASEKLQSLGLAARPWREALRDYLAQRAARPAGPARHPG